MKYALIIWLAISILSYTQMVGDLQTDENHNGCEYVQFVGGPFDVLWPMYAFIPVVGQVLAYGWAVGQTVSYGHWPVPHLKTSRHEAKLAACGEKP